MRRLFNALLSRSLRACLADRVRRHRVVLTIEPACDEFGEVIDAYGITIEDDGRPISQDHKVVKNLARSLFSEDDIEILNRGVLLSTTVSDGIQSFNLRRNPNTDYLHLTSKRTSNTSLLRFHSKIRFKLSCSEGCLLGRMHLSAFFFMLRTLTTKLMLLTPFVDVVIHIGGEKLLYLYNGLSLETSCSTPVDIKCRDLGNEMELSFRLDLPESSDFDHASTESMRDLMMQLASNLTTTDVDDAVQDASGLFDVSVMQEVQRYHPVHLLQQHLPFEESCALDVVVGVSVSKSDRVWKNGHLNVMCGIATDRISESCRVWLYDHNGIIDKGSDVILAALQRVQWERFGLELSEIRKTNADDVEHGHPQSPPNMTEGVGSDAILSTVTSEGADCKLHTLLLHFWFDETTGLGSIMTHAVEMALMDIKQQARDRLRGSVESKIHRSIDDISTAIASITERSASGILRSHVCRLLDCGDGNIDIALKQKMKATVDHVLDTKFQKGSVSTVDYKQEATPIESMRRPSAEGWLF